MTRRISFVLVLALLFAIGGLQNAARAQRSAQDHDGALMRRGEPIDETQEVQLTKSVHRLWGDHDVDLNRLAHAGGVGILARGNGISYHGGPVILNTTGIYYIWYGNWSGNTAVSILTDLANSIGGS